MNFFIEPIHDFLKILLLKLRILMSVGLGIIIKWKLMRIFLTRFNFFYNVIVINRKEKFLLSISRHIESGWWMLLFIVYLFLRLFCFKNLRSFDFGWVFKQILFDKTIIEYFFFDFTISRWWNIFVIFGNILFLWYLVCIFIRWLILEINLFDSFIQQIFTAFLFWTSLSTILSLNFSVNFIFVIFWKF